MKNIQNHKIPLVLGVTGHRDIDKSHEVNLEEKIAEIFDNLISKYKNTPLILLTPLADGADRIIAHVALRDRYKDKITVSVPLPMDAENYKDTFAKGMTNHKKADDKEKRRLEVCSKKEFHSILKLVNAQKNEYIPKTIPMLFDKEIYEKSSDNEKRQIRHKQYSIVGEYIAIHSHILIALYDECEEEKPSGTAEIVRKKCTGEYDHFKVKDEDVTYPETGIVYSIATPKGAKECTKDYEIKRLFPDNIEKKGLSKVRDKEENTYTKFHRQIDGFNKEVDQNIKEIESKAKSDIAKLKCCNDKFIHKNMMIRRSAAFLSAQYQTKMQTIEKIILVLIVITIFALMIQSDFPSFIYSKYIDPLYLALIALFFGTYYKFKKYKEKHEDYRSISEALRVQIAWNMANINDSVSLYYLSYQKNELGWIRIAVRGTNIFYLPKDNHEFKEEQVKAYWLDEQIKYFENNKVDYSNKEKSINKKIKVSFALFLLFTAIFTVLNFTTNISQCTTCIYGLSLVDIMKLVLAGVPFTIFAYLKSKQHFDGNNDLLKEYTLSLDIFNRAKLLCDKTSNKQEVYKNLGIEALRENSSWIISRRAKDYEIS